MIETILMVHMFELHDQYEQKTVVIFNYFPLSRKLVLQAQLCSTYK